MDKWPGLLCVAYFYQHLLHKQTHLQERTVTRLVAQQYVQLPGLQPIQQLGALPHDQLQLQLWLPGPQHTKPVG